MSIKHRRTCLSLLILSPCKWFVYKVDFDPPTYSQCFQYLMILLFVLWSNSHILPHNVKNTNSYQCAHSLAGSKDLEYRLAQSGDATCSGLENSEYGSRIMTLKRFGPAERCDFPKWFKEPKHWHSLNGELSYNVHQKYVENFFTQK